MDHKTHSIFEHDNFSKVTEGLQIAQCMKADDDDEKTGDLLETEVQNRLEGLSVSGTLFCSFCNVAFEDKAQQRLHYKLDWHRYNLKRNLMGRSLVSEDEFQQLADDVSSISGSETESDGEAESSEKESSKQMTDSENAGEDELKQSVSSHKLQVERHAKVFFENAGGEILSVYRCILHDKKAAPEKEDDLLSLLLRSSYKPKWAVIMLGGGHFAAAIFNGNQAVLHKTFHSYTVRAHQGKTQSSRDGRSGGSHPKSAGASLRRYNEASFNQHVQDVLTEWSTELEACSLILYRATGHNRSLLFGGRSPLFSKNDSRFRSVPFPTRRATFKEVTRVHNLLSSIEIYGSASEYKTSFPQSPKKKTTKGAKPEDTVEGTSVQKEVGKTTDSETEATNSPRSSRSPRQKKSVDRAKSRPSPNRPLPGVIAEILAASSPECSDVEEGAILFSEMDVEVSTAHNLQEYEDTVPQRIKEQRAQRLKKPVKKKKKPQKDKEAEEHNEAVKLLCKKLLAACKQSDIIILKSCVLKAQGNYTPENEEEKESKRVSEQELLDCLNKQVIDGNTILHIVAENGNTEMLRFLLETGCDPSFKNKKAQPPYAVSADRETRNAFRKFMADYPDKYDYKKSQIPGPLTEAEEKEWAEKRKAQKKIKREKEKEKRIENMKKQEEESERARFLKLSDREKRALAAERRILAQNAEGKAEIRLVARCFECAVDISGKVPFEYDIHRFCSMDCLKKHRLKIKQQH